MTAGESTRVWPHGAIETRRGELPQDLRDPGGALVWRCEWGDRGELARADFRLPGGGWASVRPTDAHPIFGPALEIAQGGERLSRFSRVDFRAPDAIPAMDDPGALPPGAGTAILGFLAARAADSGARALRYVGPYPTAALFDALAESFRLGPDPAGALEAFLAEAERRAAEARMEEIPVNFQPAPFERHFPAQGVCTQLRDGLEKVFLQGRAFAREAATARRLRRRPGGGYTAVVEIGREPYAEIAAFGEAGELLEGPRTIPEPEGPLLGRALPAEVGRALADALVPRAPVLLRGALGEALRSTPLFWGGTGADEAEIRDGGIALHPALADRFEGGELLEAIARAAELPAQRIARARLEAAWKRSTS